MSSCPENTYIYKKLLIKLQLYLYCCLKLSLIEGSPAMFIKQYRNRMWANGLYPNWSKGWKSKEDMDHKIDVPKQIKCFDLASAVFPPNIKIFKKRSEVINRIAKKKLDKEIYKMERKVIDTKIKILENEIIDDKIRIVENEIISQKIKILENEIIDEKIKILENEIFSITTKLTKK